MTDSQSKKRKRSSSETRVSNKDKANKRSKNQHQTARGRVRSKMLYKPRRKSTSARLTRPTRPIAFSLPERLTSLALTVNTVPLISTVPPKLAKSRNSTPNTAFGNIVDTPYIRLLKTQLLLTRIHHRNKNQHRNQPFYKHLNLLLRSLSRLIKIHEASTYPAPSTITKKSTSKSTSTSASNEPAASSAEQTRLSFERQAELRSQREVLESWIRETLVPGCYVAFSSLVADTQFANLGVVLMGCLADVVEVVGLMKTVERVPAPPANKMENTTRGHDTYVTAVEGWSTAVTGPDMGVVVRRVYEGSDREVEATEKTIQDDLGVIVKRQQLDSSRREQYTKTSRTAPSISSTLSTSKADGASQVVAEITSHASSTGTTRPSKPDHSLTATIPDEPTHDQPYNISDSTSRPRHTSSKPNPKPKSQVQNTIASGLGSKLEKRAARAATSNPNEIDHSKSSTQHKESRRSKGGRNQVETSTNSAPIPIQQRLETQGTEKKSRKKKKKGNAIDELFSGF